MTRADLLRTLLVERFGHSTWGRAPPHRHLNQPEPDTEWTCAKRRAELLEAIETDEKEQREAS